MGLASLLPTAVLVLAFLPGDHAISGAGVIVLAEDPLFDWMVSGQSVAAALFVVAGIKLVRGRQRRG